MADFRETFRGNSQEYGLYTINPSTKQVREDGKVEGERRTYGPKWGDPALSDAEYERHLDPASDTRLGVKPTDEDGFAAWFAIDIDLYSEEDLHLKYFDRLEELGVPMIVTRSKSGGVHMWGFLDEPAPVRRVFNVLDRITKALPAPRGHHDIFPSNPSGGGKWIHIPYFKGSECVAFNGRSDMFMDEFLEAVDENSRTIDEWEEIASDLALDDQPKKRSQTTSKKQKSKNTTDRPDTDPMWPDAPPCINLMLENGIPEGGRNDTMLHIGIFLQRAFPDDWEQIMHDINKENFDPPLDLKSMRTIAGSIARNEYNYKCHDPKIEPFCHKDVCLKRKFGVGNGDGKGFEVNFTVERFVKWYGKGREPKYDLTITMDGEQYEIELNAAARTHPRAFRNCVLLYTDTRPSIPMKEYEFLDWVEDNLNPILEKKEYPSFMIAGDKIESVLTNWVETRVKHTSDLERAVATHAPYYDKETKRLMFTAADLKRQIDTSYGRFHGIDDQDIVNTLIANKYHNETVQIGNSKVEIWSIYIDKPWFELYEDDKEKF